MIRIKLFAEGPERRPHPAVARSRPKIAVEHQSPVFGAHAQLVVVRIEYFEAILRSLRERNAMPRIFVRAVGAGLGFAGPSRNFELGPARAQPFLAQSIFDGVHRRSSRPRTRNWTVILAWFGGESKALPCRRAPDVRAGRRRSPAARGAPPPDDD